MGKIERLRFAPSPTGDLHVGGARAALFNWLYARKVGGKFLLRIEDTDIERSSEKALQSILDTLRWLGLNWDEEPVYQSRRGILYRKAVDRLLENGTVYRCYCTVEDLDTEREKAMKEKLPYQYSGKCRFLAEETVLHYIREQRPFTIRFRVPDGETSFDDMVHGVTTFQNETIGDFIVARADGSPVYLLGVAVDDGDMGITLVMRGDDHISNTPKQIMLMRALGNEIPRFAHLPQVLGEDKKKLSKRHGADSVMAYKEMGFLPSSIVNFLALLGWNPGDEREKMSMEELIDAFSIEGISKKSSVFNIKKLEWLNGQYLNELVPEDLFETVGHVLVKRALIAEPDLKEQHDYIIKFIELMKERCRLVGDFADLGAYFFKDPDTYEEKGMRKHFSNPSTVDRLMKTAEKYGKLDIFKEKAIEDATREVAETFNIIGGNIIHPVRLAVTGMTFGPGLFQLLELIGKTRVVKRIQKAADHILTVRKQKDENI